MALRVCLSRGTGVGEAVVGLTVTLSSPGKNTGINTKQVILVYVAAPQTFRGAGRVHNLADADSLRVKLVQ